MIVESLQHILTDLIATGSHSEYFLELRISVHHGFQLFVIMEADVNINVFIPWDKIMENV